MAINQRGVTNTRTKILKLRKPTVFYLLTRVMVEMKANQSKHWTRSKKFFVQTAKASKTGLLMLSPLAITSLLSKKTRNKMTRT